MHRSITTFQRWSMAAVLSLPACLPLSAVGAEATVKLLVHHSQVSALAASGKVAAFGGRVTHDLSRLGAVAVEVPASQVEAIRAMPGVLSVEVDAERHVLGAPGMAPARAGVAALARSTVTATSVVPNTEVTPYGIHMVQADKVGAISTWTPTVCIIDSGIDGRHEDLKRVTMTGKNYTSSGRWNTDELGHGTHVAGTIAGVDNRVGVVGVNGKGQVNLRINKVFDASGSTTSASIALAMLDCKDAGAKVVSMSLGGSTATSVEQAAARILSDAGILIVAAAGNGGSSAVSYPAGFRQVMSVAAVDESKAHASFSQFNDDVEIAAPGVGVLSTVPTGTGREVSLSLAGTSYAANMLTGTPVGSASAPLYDFGFGTADDAGVAGKVCLISRGTITFAEKVTRCQSNGGVAAIIYNNVAGSFVGTLGTTVTTIPSVSVSQADGATLLAAAGSTADLSVVATNYAYYDGTSMATPHVAGVAARIWSHNSLCSADQVRKALTRSAEDLGVAGRDVEFGHGLVRAKAALNKLVDLCVF